MDLRHQLQRTLGDAYTLQRELGGGGMSRVFVAEERSLGRTVVVKVLSPELAAGVSAERFTREIKLAASLQQANIVPVLTAGESDGLPYFTMPFVEGESLRARLQRDGALPIADVVGIGGDVAKALAYAHARNIVHRDIKPDNVLLSGGTAVVTDFGIAKAISASRTSSGATLTQMGTSIGTPAYMSPEQAAGDPDIDQRADLYALGCMLYELLAGTPPFANRSPQRVLAAHMGETPAPIASHRGDVPGALAAVVMRCLEKDPSARPQSATDVARALDNVTSGGQTVMPPVLLARGGMLQRALAWYAVAFVGVAIVTRAAMIVLGLPDWVFPGALVVMLLGLPAILFTGYVQRVTHRALTATPTLTPRGSVQARGTMLTIAIKASPHMSWKRTARLGTVALGAFGLLVTTFMVLRAAGIGPAGSLLASGKLAQREGLLVTDFEATGADSTLSTVLALAMRTSLGESRAVSVVSIGTITNALLRMRRPATSKFDLTLAQELAQREGIKAIVAGSVASLSGAGYVVSARLLSVPKGDELATAQETVSSANALIPAIDKLARALRERIGESIKTIRTTPPLEKVTSASIDALRKFTDAHRAYYVEGDYTKANALFRETIALDSTFAMAYFQYSMSILNSGLGTLTERKAAFANAWQHRDRLPETERFTIEAFQYGPQGAHPDRAKMIATWETLLERAPETPEVANLLAVNGYYTRGEYARAESLYRRAMVTDSTSIFPRLNLINAQLRRGAFEEARRTLSEARKRLPPEVILGTEAHALYAVRKLDSAVAVYGQLANSANAQRRAEGLRGKAFVYILRGQLQQARMQSRQAAALDSARGVPRLRLRDSLRLFGRQVLLYDDPAGALKGVEAALAADPLSTLPSDRRPYFQLATVYAQAGRPDRARATLAQYDADIRDTVQRRVDQLERDAALAWIDMAEGKPRDAVAKFRRSAMLPDGPATPCVVCVEVNVARAFDRANLADSAITALEKFVNAPGLNLVNEFDVRPWALKRLGELYDNKGDRERAVKYLSMFVELWKDADPDLQKSVRTAQRRIEELRAREPR